MSPEEQSILGVEVEDQEQELATLKKKKEDQEQELATLKKKKITILFCVGMQGISEY